MSVRQPMTDCGHGAVASAGYRPDSGGQVHEIGSCADCGVRLQRTSPLDGWTPSDEED